MLLSELIVKAQEMFKEHGDFEVLLRHDAYDRYGMSDEVEYAAKGVFYETMKYYIE